MKLAIDVDYRDNNRAKVAGVLFNNWEDSIPFQTVTIEVDNVLPYESGSFYKRELPCILTLLETLKEKPSLIIVDGYVYLSEGKKGLGAYLFRGESKKPLYITLAGINEEEAKKSIAQMHGKYRFPTLLKEVDRVCREA